MFSLIVDFRLFLLATLMLAASIFSRADNAPVFDDPMKGSLPFSFVYDGKKSSDLLSTWALHEHMTSTDSADVRAFTYTDPATGLKVTSTTLLYHDFPAIDWVLEFTNDGQKDTPIISDVQPLTWSFPVTDHAVLHWAQGSNASGDDFAPHDTDLGPNAQAQLNSAGGRSSNNNLPFFNLQDGANGLIGAIGWTGNWVAHFETASDGKSVAMAAGMRATHFLLHPGETVRTPRIVLLRWKGDRTRAQNQWRQFMLAHYSPRDPRGNVVTMPLVFGQGNDSALGPELTTIQALHDKQVPIDDYWVDATWYGSGRDWGSERGNWFPDPKKYPDGLKPLGDALAADGIGFVLWVEAEAAQPGSKFLTEHPDWYLRVSDPHAQGLLDLGNPEARKGMTDFLTDLFNKAGVTWYRQDFNVEPEGFWAAKDTPDRVGITEMKDITGLYQFWDDLRAAHPGLQIDNCASGGRRLDIEMISRSVSFFRTDHACNCFDPLDNQKLTQGLNVWLPLNAGVYAGVAPSTTNTGASLIYAMRSSYSAGWAYGTDRLSIDMMKPGGDEFDEIRPYFLGDFYPLTPYGGDPAAWAIQQWDRPDMKGGIVLCFRRQGSATASMTPKLQAIDPAAQYSVETRAGFGKGDVKTMSGADLANLEMNVPDKPGSLLVLYKKL